MNDSPLMNNLLGVFIIMGMFLADVLKTTHGPLNGGPQPWERLREPLREPLYINSLLKTYEKLEKP